MARDPAFSSQHAVYPEAVKARFLDHDQGVKFALSLLRLCPKLGKAGKQGLNIAAGDCPT